MNYTCKQFQQLLSNQQFVLDLQRIISFTGLKDEKEILEYLLVIRYEFFSMLHQIQLSIDTQNRDGLKKQVHSLKGLSNAIGYEPLADMMSEADQNVFTIKWDEMQSITRNAFICFYRLRDQIEEFVCSGNLFSYLGSSTVRCLVISNRHTIRNILSIMLEKMGCAQAVQVQTVKEAVEAIQNHSFAAVVSTLQLQDESGTHILQAIRSQQTNEHHMLPVFFIAGKTDAFHFRDAVRQDANGIIGNQFKQQNIARMLMRLNDYRHIPAEFFPSPAHYAQHEHSPHSTIVNDQECIELRIHEIPPGSILAEDLTDCQNRVILKQGHRLTPFDIDNFRDLTQFEGQYHQVHILF